VSLHLPLLLVPPHPLVLLLLLLLLLLVPLMMSMAEAVLPLSPIIRAECLRRTYKKKRKS
jgi:hypothetical protein